MRFGWNDEQRQLMDMLRRFVADRHDFDTRRERLRSGDGTQIWNELAELGLMALPFSEEFGGIGGSMLDLVIVAEALGRGLVIEPYLPSVILAGGILKRAAPDDATAALLSSLAAGEKRLAFAHTEAKARYNPVWCTLEAKESDGRWHLSGQKSMVFGGDEAEALVVLARTTGKADDEAGHVLLLVDAQTPGLTIHPFRCIDGTGAAELSFEDVQVPAQGRLDAGGNALAVTRAVLDEAAVYACAEMCGAIAALNARTLAYLQERKAFGQELAGFQVLQHRLVDMKVSEEQCVAMTLKAAEALAAGHANAALTVAGAKYLVSEEAREVAKQAVHLHGAIGVTDELDVSHYFRRIMVLSAAFGDADHHLARRAATSASHVQETA